MNYASITVHFRDKNAIKSGVFKGFQCFKNGAGTRSRTKDFHITNVALYQLSYTGVIGFRSGAEYSVAWHLRLAPFITHADQYLDAFLFGAFGEWRQTFDADLTVGNVGQFARLDMKEVMMSMGRRVIEFATRIDV